MKPVNLLMLKGKWVLSLMLLVIAGSVWAADMDWQHRGMQHHEGHHARHGATEMQGASHHGRGMALSGHWRHSLSDEQKRRVDEMHLELEKKTADLAAKIALEKVELALLVTMDAPDQKAIDAKIDKISTLKKQKMKSRYAHILKMRQILNEQQRLSFDMAVMKKAKHSGKSGHH